MMKECEYLDMVTALAPCIDMAFAESDHSTYVDMVAEQFGRVRACCAIVRNTYRGYQDMRKYQRKQRESHPRITYDVRVKVEVTPLPDGSEIVQTVQLQMATTHEGSVMCQRFFERYACALLEQDQHIVTSHKYFCNQENIFLAIVQPKSRAFLRTATILTSGEWNTLVHGKIPGRLWQQGVMPIIDIDRYLIM